MVEETLVGRLEDLSVEELERMSARQQQLLKMQRQQAVSKEERLRALMGQYQRHEAKLDSYKHLKTNLQAQEHRLRELLMLKAQLQRQTNDKNQLSDELEKTKALFALRERELAEAVAKVDILSQQLDRTRQHGARMKNAAHEPPPEVERLRNEQRVRAQHAQTSKRKVEEKDTALLHKTLQRNQLDHRINEMLERIQKRRQQLQPLNGRPPGMADAEMVKAPASGRVPVADRENHFDLVQANRNKPAPLNLCEEVVRSLPNGRALPGDGVRPLDSQKQPMPAQNGQKTAPSAPQPVVQPPALPPRVVTLQREDSVSDDSAVCLSSADNDKVHPASGADVTSSPSLSSSSTSQRDDPPGATAASGQRASPVAVSVKVSPPKLLNEAHRRHSRSKDTLPPAPPPLDVPPEGPMAVPAKPAAKRVKFDPQALLLDASLEGELELVIKTCQQVVDPSASNDEGITALHNAICAGHLPIVKFLVEYGCDVNAQDSDGWSPLHCAASCNNRNMCQFLIGHGACIFSVTSSDQESAAEKCEEDEADFEGCSQYLLQCMHDLGRVNDGIVYAVYHYEAQNADELSFRCNDKMRVLRLSDEAETEWYWAEHLGPGAVANPAAQGYIPRNLLALQPRVQRNG